MEEYIVTLYRKDDLAGFYDEIELEGSHCDQVPERCVQCVAKREISRNTHYLLTEEEAEALKADERVWDVIATKDIPELKTFASQTSYFSKSPTSDSNHASDIHNTDKNWALYRNFIDSNVTNWGHDLGNSSAIPRVNATISWELEGQDVDIIINDSLPDPDHPEYAVNADGTGGSRVQNIDWTTYNQYEGSGYPNHWKSFLFDRFRNHGAICTSSAAGNTHGLARKANIYTINSNDRPKYAKFRGTRTGNVLTVTSVVAGSEPIAVGDDIVGTSDLYIGTSNSIASFGTGTGGVGTYNLSSTPSNDWLLEDDYFTCFGSSAQNYMWDYIRAFHRYKPINTATGKRNPTVVNASYGFVDTDLYSNLSSIYYRGTSHFSSSSIWTPTSLWSDFGIIPENLDTSSSYFQALTDFAFFRADVESAIDDGVIVVAAAGNTGDKIDESGGDDYDNVYNTVNYYHRGGVFGQTDAIICGALDNYITDRKADYSARGPRVDTYAGGTFVIASDSGNFTYANIVSWSRTANVATFNIAQPAYPWLAQADYAITNGESFRVKLEMTGTTSLNGYYDWLGSFTTPPSVDPTGFTLNIPGPDVPLTTEVGYFYNADEDHSFLYNQGFIDPRDDTKYITYSDGTSFSAPMTTGLVACWVGYFGRLDRDEFRALLQETGALNKMTTTLNNDDYNGVHNLLGGSNVIQRYAEFRPTTGVCYPHSRHKARSTATQKGQTDYVPYPRTRVVN